MLNYDNEKQKYLKYKLKYLNLLKNHNLLNNLNLLNKMGGSSADIIAPATPLILKTNTDDKTEITEEIFNERIELLKIELLKNEQHQSLAFRLKNMLLVRKPETTIISIMYKEYVFNVELNNENKKPVFILSVDSKYLPSITDYNKSFNVFKEGQKFSDSINYTDFIQYAEYYIQIRSIVKLPEDDLEKKKNQLFEQEMKLLNATHNSGDAADLRPLEIRFSDSNYYYKVSLIRPHSGSELNYRVSVFTKTYDGNPEYNDELITTTLNYTQFNLYLEKINMHKNNFNDLKDENKALDITNITDDDEQKINETSFNERMVKLKFFYNLFVNSFNKNKIRTYIKYNSLCYQIDFNYDKNLKKCCYYIKIKANKTMIQFLKIQTDNDQLNYARFIVFANKLSTFTTQEEINKWTVENGLETKNSTENALIIIDSSGNIQKQVFDKLYHLKLK